MLILFPLGARVKEFGAGSSPVLLSDVTCKGTEESLLDCDHDTCGLVHCPRVYDVGVECEGKTVIMTRVV